MRKKPVSLKALSKFLHIGDEAVKAACKAAGVVIEPVEVHYADDRERATSRRTWRRLTQAEYLKVIEYVRKLQGTKALARAGRRGSSIPQ